MKSNGRHHFSPEEKLRIVVHGLSGVESIADICRREGISTVQFYSWKKRLMSSAGDIFGKQKKTSRREEELGETLIRKDQVIAHLTEENLQLKKNPGAVLQKYLRQRGGR